MEKPSRQVIEDFLQFLINKKKEQSIHSYISIRNAISIFAIPFSSVPLKKGTPLYRGRNHEKPNQFFTKITELSNRLDVNNIESFGRANEPLQSIFYCSTNFDTTLFEVSKIQKSKGRIKVEEITYGKWILQKDIYVANLPLSKNLIGKNQVADNLNSTFEKLIEKYKNEDTNDWLNVIDLFSEEFSREIDENEQDYLISCAISNYIYSTQFYNYETKSAMYMDGITYPSTKFTDEGMNLALLPELFYNGSLLLESTRYQRMEKTNENKYIETGTKLSQSIDQKNNRIIW